uniref:Uncharacterized protein n=1 Tax=Amphimedon queenslandica TaxID=400682 RepID=A0A1X7VU40_AMPQE
MALSDNSICSERKLKKWNMNYVMSYHQKVCQVKGNGTFTKRYDHFQIQMLRCNQPTS